MDYLVCNWCSTNRKWSTSVVVLVYLTIVCPSVLGSFCDPSHLGTPAPNAPELPELQQGAAQMDVELNLANSARTVSAKLYYDYSGNRATINFFDHGRDGSFIFNYNTNELYNVIPDTNCSVTPLNNSTYASWLGTTSHIGQAPNVFRFGKNYSEVYQGTTSLRGMPVYHWRACINGSMLVDYYFTRKGNWSTATTLPSVPVQATVSGVTTYPNGSSQNYTRTFEFFNYMLNNDLDPALFQPPTDVLCIGQKNTKPLPTLPKRFYYRTEVIYQDLEAVTFEDTWYDESFKLYRRDYRSLVATYPDYTTHPLTEIHDYKTGVRYVIDKSFGNCSSVPLSSNMRDSQLNATLYNVNGSVVLSMKNPLQLFNLNLNYTYIGQTNVRGIGCDTFIAEAHDFTVPEFIRDSSTVVLTFYFLSQGWTDIGDSERGQNHKAVPIQTTVRSVDMGFSAQYNYVDFDPEPATLNVFDTSSCFPEANKVTFQVTFPGTFKPSQAPSLTSWSQLVLAEKMGVSILRLSNIHLTNDDVNIFITATLLDKAFSSSEFTESDGKVAEYSSSTIIYKSSSAVQCASFCVNNAGFICNSFDYCSNDQSCHLSKLHTEDGQRMVSNRTCNHFSRTVNGVRPEITIAAAYQSLRNHVYNKTLILSNIGSTNYTAVDVAVLFGWVNPSVSLPKLSDQFSYSAESTVPAIKHAYAAKVWYDRYFKLIRYDSHSDRPTYPFYTTNPLTVIEDYHMGVRYVLDKMLMNCSVTPLAKTDFGSLGVNFSAGHDIALKHPLALLGISDAFRFVGQQTIRGLTCNIFEAMLPSFPFMNYTVPAVLRYAFLAADWVETSGGYLGGDTGQPVRVDVTMPKASLYIQSNIFNYDTDHPDMSVFDIHKCFTPKQKIEVEIVFPGSYMVSLNTSTDIFMIEAIDKLENLTGAARLRFQQQRMDYDAANVYFYTTIVDQTDRFLYFTHVPQSRVPQKVDKVLSMVSGKPEDCLDACLEITEFRCESFYFCSDSAQCLLSKGPVPDGSTAVTAQLCQSYSRTVNDSRLEPTNKLAVQKLKNAVYKGSLVLEIPVPNTDKNYNFTASFVNVITDIRQRHNRNDNYMSHFTVTAAGVCMSDLDDMIFNSVSVDECAATCVNTIHEHCRGFTYKQEVTSLGNLVFSCYISKVNPATINVNRGTKNPACTTYGRHFVDDYQATVRTVPAGVTTTVVSANSSEQCARQCNLASSPKCRMFQYCANTLQCRLFPDRTFTMINGSFGQTCNMFTSFYLSDFNAVDAGTYRFAATVPQVLGISLPQCPEYCIQQLGNNCKGFYYSQYVQTCFLTGDDEGRGTVTMDETGDMYNQYTRIYFPPSAAVSTPTQFHTTRKSTSNVPKTSVTCPPVNPPVTTPYFIPTPAMDTQNKNNRQKTNNTGLTAGVSVGTFLLGLVIGVLTLHFYRRRQNLDRDMKTNFIEHEDI